MGDMTDNEDLKTWIVSELKESKTKSSEWRTLAKRCYAYYAGDQWDEEDKAVLEERGTPPVVFNRVARTINAIAGLEVQNRQEVRYIPRETGDSAVNEVLTAASKWVRDNCDAEDEESESFQDTLICGMGWTDTNLDYEVEQDGRIVIERSDPLGYFWDWRARKRNLDDARWRAVVLSMSDKDVKDKWPHWEAATSGEQWLDEVEEPHDSTPPAYNQNQQGQGGKKPVEVVKFQWYDKETYYRVQTSGGQIVELTEAKFARLQPTLDAMGLRYVAQRRRHYKCAYLVGNELLEVRDLESQVGFTLNCITGLRDRNSNTWFGLVALMIDPQMWANKWLAQTMHILNSNSKGGLLAEEGAFANSRKAEKEWADPQAITWLRSGGLGKVQQKQISQLPSGVESLLRYALESINDVPGVNSELLGLAERQQPGILEAQRKQAGVVMLGIFFDSLRRYRKEQGRVLAKMIVDFIADGRLIRIVGDQGAQIVPLLRDPLTFNYDVVVDDAPNSPNQKEKVAAILQQMLPNMMQMGVPFIPEVLDFLPLPEQMVQKWKQAMPQGNQAMAAMQQQMQQMQQAMGQQMQEMGQRLASAEMQLKNKQDENAIKAREIELRHDSDVTKAAASVEVAKIAASQKEMETRVNAAIEMFQARLGGVEQSVNAPKEAPAPAEPPVINVTIEKGGKVKKEIVLEAPSGAVYKGMVMEDEEGEVE